MKKIYLLFIFSTSLVLAVLSSCQKENDFLDTKPRQNLAVPRNLADLQALVANENIFNRNYPSLGEVSSDDYFLSPSLWTNDFIVAKNAYVWAPEIYPSTINASDWNSPYQQVYYANTILELLPTLKIAPNEEAGAHAVKGSALFYRSMAFYNLLQIFTMPYDSTSAARDPGIPLPLVPDLTAKVPRASQAACYGQIIADLHNAATLLPDLPPIKTRPSKAAVYGLLSRIYLGMGNYTLSLKYASAFLGIFHVLQDFNKLDPKAFPVYPNFSPEEVFHASYIGYAGLGFQSQVDTSLYRSFNDANDLRPSIFFYHNGSKIGFNSQFDYHNAISFTISTNEVYLTRAECQARLNDPASALSDLNSLLVTRWKTGTFTPLTAATADDALRLILRERRKELVMTGIRWTDLRRLNRDPQFARTMYRNISGTIYSLAPNDRRYALPIPPAEINTNPILQNPR